MITANIYTINWMLLKTRNSFREVVSGLAAVFNRKSLIQTPLIVFLPAVDLLIG